MLQTNLIFGIQEKIKAGARAKKEAGSMIEESTEITPVKSKVECVLESSFIAGIYDKASKANKKEEFKRELVMESFQITKAKKKLEKDVQYFNYLFENFVDDVFKDQYKELLESAFDDTIKLYRECDVTPRFISQALDTNELNESQIVDIYKNKLNRTIKEDYTKPMLSGKITELYESQIKEITKKLIQEGSEIDANQVKVYMPFEETLYQFNRSILVPDIAESRINAFMESVTEEYLEFIEESAADILQQLEKKIKLLSAMISPNVFDKVVDAEGIEAPKMAGITIATDTNFSEPEETIICPMQAAEDAEAASEMADEDEAQDIEDQNGDLIDAEDAAREKLDLATDSEDYEDLPTREAEAEESAAEETAENPDQPGAIDIETYDEVIGTPDESGVNTNTSDVALSGQGNDHGVDSADGAEVPGGGSADTETEDDGEETSDIGDNISQDDADDTLEKDQEDVSEADEESVEIKEIQKDPDHVKEAEDASGIDEDEKTEAGEEMHKEVAAEVEKDTKEAFKDAEKDQDKRLENADDNDKDAVEEQQKKVK